jgi:O-antigen ligase
LKEKVRRGVVEIEVKRLRGPGRLFGDPNDVCAVFVFGILLCLSRITDKGRGAARWLWLTSLGLFGWALVLTQSRGGLLGLAAGLGVLGAIKIGWKRTLVLGVLALPLLYLAGPERISDMSMSRETTSQQRVLIWAEGVQMFKESPVLGIGANEFSKKLAERLNLEENKGLIAHNSYVQAFTELGFFGGALFVGAFVLALTMLARPIDAPDAPPPDDDPDRIDLERFRPYLLAATAGYAICLCSLSLNYISTTYMVLGLTAAYVRTAAEASPAPRELPVVDLGLARRLLVVGVAALGVLYVFIRVFGRF